MKFTTAVLLALLIMLSAGSASTGRDIRPAAVAQAADIWIQAALSVPAAAPVPKPEPVTEPAADAVTQSQKPAPEAESAQVAAYKPEILAVPDIPSGAPAPAQVKSLPESGIVCLTFDDGYSEAAIFTILDCLRENGVRCTFFVIGACLKLYGGLWRQAVEDGHEIAYHTMRHRNLNRCSNAQIVRDINQWNETARSVLGTGYRIPKIARAPGGSANARVRRLFNCLKYTLIYWSSDTFTGVYRRSKSGAGTRTASYILRHTQAGSISLQHFNRYDAASVSRYIGELKARFRLGTVSEALAIAERRARRGEKRN
jgi:peptidoglycan-N-acetylmuramic acid deacetylase